MSQKGLGQNGYADLFVCLFVCCCMFVWLFDRLLGWMPVCPFTCARCRLLVVSR